MPLTLSVSTFCGRKAVYKGLGRKLPYRDMGTKSIK